MKLLRLCLPKKRFSTILVRAPVNEVLYLLNDAWFGGLQVQTPPEHSLILSGSSPEGTPATVPFIHTLGPHTTCDRLYEHIDPPKSYSDSDRW